MICAKGDVVEVEIFIDEGNTRHYEGEVALVYSHPNLGFFVELKGEFESPETGQERDNIVFPCSRVVSWSYLKRAVKGPELALPGRN